jgi:hypothetical protein
LCICLSNYLFLSFFILLYLLAAKLELKRKPGENLMLLSEQARLEQLKTQEEQRKETEITLKKQEEAVKKKDEELRKKAEEDIRKAEVLFILFCYFVLFYLFCLLCFCVVFFGFVLFCFVFFLLITILIMPNNRK